MANRGKMRQIADVIRSKIVVEIGVFYYRLPFVTLGDLGCTARCAFTLSYFPFFAIKRLVENLQTSHQQ